MTQPLTPDEITAIRCRAAWLCGVIDGCRKSGNWINSWMSHVLPQYEATARRIWLDGPEEGNEYEIDMDEWVRKLHLHGRCGERQEVVTNGQ